MLKTQTSLCAVDECARGVHARGWCHYHYVRWHRYGDPHAPLGASMPRNQRCQVPDCHNKHVSGGLCRPHYDVVRRSGRSPRTIETLRALELEQAYETLERWEESPIETPDKAGGALD